MRRDAAISLVLSAIGLAACGLSVVGSSDVDGGAAPAAPAVTADGAASDARAIDAEGCAADLASDPHHCGSCHHDCLGGACTAGECQPVVFAPSEPGASGVAVRGQSLLWTREAAGLVRTMPLDGGSATTLLSGISGPTDVASDGDLIFVTERQAGFVERFQPDAVSKWRIGIPSATGIAVDGATIYWTKQDQDEVQSTDLGATLVRSRALGLNYPADVAVSDGTIYVASGSGILSAPAAEGTPVSTVSPTSTFKDGGGDLIHTGLAVDGSTVYFTIGTLGIVASVPTTGGTAHVLARGQQEPLGIAVTPKAVFWANRAEGTIMMLAR